MALNIQVLSDNRLFPTVFNIVQGSNNVDTVVYTLENYIVGERDLSTYDWYVHLIGVEGVDAVKLTSAIVGGKLQITFDLTEYVTRLGNTLTYQLVAKDEVSAVWNSAKGVILNADSINADDKIVAEYPSILRQWELRLEEIAGSLDTAIYYIPYGQTLPKEERVAGRLYYQYLYAENKNGQLEDSNGNILIPEVVAKNIGITAIDGLTARTVQEALQALKVMVDDVQLPSQEGNAGKVLATNGISFEWTQIVNLSDFKSALDSKADLDLNNTIFKDFYNNDGVLKWGNKNVLLNMYQGSDVTEKILLEAGATTSDDPWGGARLILDPGGENEGAFSLTAKSKLAGKSVSLMGSSSGSLTWGDKSILTPAGILAPFAGTTAPSGWLVCDGSAVSRTTYKDLFTAIGTKYGAGDGSTTFNLPTQSVLPLGTTAPVVTRDTMQTISNRPALRWGRCSDGYSDMDNGGTVALYSNGNTFYSGQNQGGGDHGQIVPKNLYADMTNATGANAIVCIKY